MERQLTIFTPTYNRAALLKRAYESLCRQSNQNFVWLIVDDGSADDTKDIVQEWILQGKLDIRFFVQENGGKHTAYNKMLDELDTELVMIALDSDDYLKDNAVETMLKAWSVRQAGTKGMVFACEGSRHNGIMYDKFAPELESRQISLRKAFQRGFFKGEAEYLVQGELAKAFRYPVYPGERFLTEAYVYIQIDAPFEWKRDSVYIRDYQRGGLTDSRYQCYCENPCGWLAYNRLRFAAVRPCARKLKYAVFIGAFRRMKGDRRAETAAPLDRLFLLCGHLPGICLAKYMKRKGERR